MHPCLGNSFEQFIKERRYLMSVSVRTEQWYRESFKWLSIENPSEADLKACVIRMREHGLKPVSCNNRIRAINAYLRWSGSSLKIPRLKTDKLIPPTYSAQQLKAIIDFKPKSWYQKRLHILILTKMDTGCRISELLSLKTADVNLDGLYFKVFGKGSKERIIPFSIALRKHLVCWLKDNSHELLFPTFEGLPLCRRDVLRDLKKLCKKLGFTAPRRSLHALRHTFSVNYLRRGGSVFHLQRALGHSSLEQSREYANLINEDLLEMQQKVSILNSTSLRG